MDTYYYNLTFDGKTIPYRTFDLEFYESAADEMANFQRSMSVIALTDVVFITLAVYVILNNSPAQFGNYKYYLLNIVFWSGFSDLFINMLYVPYSTHPLAATCSCGLLQWFTSYHSQIVFFSIQTILNGATGASILSAFIFRYLSLSEKGYLMHKPVFMFLISLLHLTSLPDAIRFYFVIVLNEEAVMKIEQQRVPLVLKFLSNQSCFVFTDSAAPETKFWNRFIPITTLILNSLTVLVLIYKILSYIRKFKETMSRNTLRSHKNLTVSLIAQAAIPALFMVIPIGINLILVPKFFVSYGRTLARYTSMFILQCQTLHSTFNTLAMILIIKPYREAVFKKIVWLKPHNRLSHIIDHQTSASFNATAMNQIQNPRM